MSEIILPKSGETLRIRKNEGVSYAILRKNLKDGETLSKTEIEKEFQKLNNETKEKIKNISYEIDKNLQKPILEGDFIVPNIDSENIGKTTLKIKVGEGISHAIIRAKTGENSENLTKKEIEKIFLKQTEETKNNFKTKLEILSNEYKNLKTGDEIQINLQDFDLEIFEFKDEENVENSAEKSEQSSENQDLENPQNSGEQSEENSKNQNLENSETQIIENPIIQSEQNIYEEEVAKQSLSFFNQKNSKNFSIDFNSYPLIRIFSLELNGNYSYMEEGFIIYGEFKDGDIIKGYKLFSNGDRYEGEFKDGKMDGEGEIFFNIDNKGKQDFGRYKGEFKNEKFDGQGILTLVNNDTKVGIFRDGELYTGVYDINWKLDKYFINGKLVSSSIYRKYLEGNS